MRRLLLVLLVLPTACVTKEAPIVLPCRASAGALEVLPSLVDGVEISRASWRTHASNADMVAQERLILSTTIHARRSIAQGELAVLFDAPGPHAIVDESYFEEGATAYNLSATRPLFEAGATRTTVRTVDVSAGFASTPLSRLGYCPRTVRIAPRDRIALLLSPDLETVDGQATRIGRARSTSPIAVLMDTSVDFGPASTLVVGAALNTSDTTLRGVIVGLVTTKDSAPGAMSGGETAVSADTLEYLLGDVAPHELVGFSGGTVADGERIVQRVAYSSRDLRDREAAGEIPGHRASAAGMAGRIQAARRADCAAGRVMCAH